MKIIINGRFLTQRITGVQRYAREILAELDKIIAPNEAELAISAKTSEIPEYNNIKVVKTGIFENLLWEHISFPLYVAKNNGIALNLCNTAPIFSTGIVCIHDVKIKVRPCDFSKKFLMWYRLLFANECKNAYKIITVSEFSKKEIIKYYKVAPEKITVISNAWQHYERIEYDEKTLEKYKLRKKQYFFAIGSLEPNKNLKWIAQIAVKNPEESFVVAGSINNEIFSNGLGFNCPDNINLLGYICDEEAKTLMRDCKAFLFPSFYEGFGIPPLEAMSVGCKSIIVSDTEIMHEIFSDNVNYIDPLNFDYDIQCLTKNISSSQKILDKYSWKKSAMTLYNLIRTLE